MVLHRKLVLDGRLSLLDACQLGAYGIDRLGCCLSFAGDICPRVKRFHTP
jgi:hypothetical protein